MLTLQTGPTVFTPYYNEWNRYAYERSEPFVESPWDVPASSTSGSAVVITKTDFVGLTKICDATFAWDGTRLTVTAPADALFHTRCTDLAEAWADYHRALNLPAVSAPFGRVPEYATWVEQVLRRQPDQLPGAELSPVLITELLDNIDAQNWPRGRFCVDEGWCDRHGPGGYGTYTPRPQFDLPRIAAQIRERGHVPGIWLAPPLICPASTAAQRHPGAVGPPVNMAGETPWNRFHFMRPGPESQEILREVFQRCYAWGYRKFKLDIFYGPRRDMAEISRQCAEAVADFAEPVELESHIPDALIAQHMHIVRINDVLISSAFPDWRKVAQGHYDICATSAPHHLLNLDHLGGNDPARLSEAEFQEHIAMTRAWLPRGHAVIGVKPNRFSAKTQAVVRALLQQL